MDDQNISRPIPLVTESIRILQAQLYPFPELDRIWLRIALSPFTRPPNLEAIIRDPGGQVAASMYMVEWRDPHISLTMHLRRPPQPGGRYVAELLLTEKGETLLDRKEVAFDLVFVEPKPEDVVPTHQ